ncbi:MAG: SDR family NAD(P)-dependent oxidoreductase [Mycobacterium sp.]
MGEMTGRIALVTGASSGIGLATAEVLAREGADVALLARPEDDLAEAVRAVQAHGRKAIAFSADVRDPVAVRAVFEQAEAELGPLDAVHNNAGISAVGPLVDTSDDTFRALVDINLAGSFYVLREAARVMQPRRAGAIVNTGSELALIGQPGYVAYTATKGAIAAMTRSAAAELVSWGIRVNSVCPGTTRTPLLMVEFEDSPDPDAEIAEISSSVAAGRFGEPQEIAEAVVFLLSDRASYMVGTQMVVDGGRSTCIPAGNIGVSHND